MKFFVPYAADDGEAEQVWAAVRMALLGRGLATTRRRIHALQLAEDGDRHLLEVGMSTPDGDTVHIILEAGDLDVFYVCTPSHGVLEGVPYVLGLDADNSAIDFDEEVVGHA